MVTLAYFTFIICLSGALSHTCNQGFDTETKKCYADYNTKYEAALMDYYRNPNDVQRYCGLIENATDVFFPCVQKEAVEHSECSHLAYEMTNGLRLSLMAPSTKMPNCNITFPSCNSSTIQSLGTCVDIFTSEISNITETTIAGDFPTLCSRYNNASDTAYKCVTDLNSMDYMCSNIAKIYRANISHQVQQINITCNSCSALRISKCFGLMTLPPPQGMDLQKYICNHTNNIKKCLEPSYRNCDRDDIDHMIEPTGLNEMEEVCTPSCSELHKKYYQLQQCVSNITAITTYNYDTVCSYVNDLVNCLVQAAGSCHFVLEHLGPQLQQLYPIMSSYKCNIKVGASQYTAKGCGLQKMTECLAPVLGQISPFNLSQITNLDALYNSIQVWQAVLVIDSSRADVCRKASSSMQSSKSCSRNEYSKCSQSTLMLDSHGSKTWGTWRKGISDQKPQVAIDPLLARLPTLTDQFKPPSNTSDELLNSKIMLDDKTYNVINAKVHMIDYACKAACSNITARTAGFDLCLSALGYKVDNISFILADIDHKFNRNQNFSSSCSSLKSMIKCGHDHMKGCPMTEYSMTQYMGGAIMHTAVSLCKLAIGFPLRHELEACDNPRFVHNEISYVPQRCEPTSLTEADFNVTDVNDTVICSALQEQIHCYVQNSKCCETRLHLLEPRRHTWGFFNQKMSCNLFLQTKNIDTAKIKIKPISPASGSCDYSDVIKCYTPLLKLVDVNFTAVSNLTRQHILKMLMLKRTIMNDSTKCLSDSEFTKIEVCVKSFTDRCRYPATCDKVLNNTPKDVWGYMPLADLLGLADVSSLCGQDCKKMKFDLNSFDMCDVNDFIKESRNVMWASMIGNTTSVQCGKIKKIMDCITPKIGNCGALARHLNQTLEIHHQVQLDTLRHCQVSLPNIQPSSLPPTKPTNTSDASENKAGLLVVILGMLIVVYIV